MLIINPFVPSVRGEVLNLTKEGTYDTYKVLIWLNQNKAKINLKLYNLRKNQYLNIVNQQNQYRLELPSDEVHRALLANTNCPELIVLLLLQRGDIVFSQTLVNIGQTVHEYLYDSPVM